MPATPAADSSPTPSQRAKRWVSRMFPGRTPAPSPTLPPTRVAPPSLPSSPAPKTVLDYIDERTIALDVDDTDRNAVIRRLATLMAATGIVLDVDAVVEAALEREAISTTGIGEGIAIPHAATASCTAPLLGFARSRAGVDWKSLDGAPATLIFMIAVPETGVGTEHLKVLAYLSRSLMTPSFRAEIEMAATPADVLAALAASVGPAGPAQ
ncbi:PTS sugar transporter subunit IIA [Cryobacterium sp. SO1]|uniref:PTS sugar transporter subunit IIA n=1 Tax=Cryobacterium sp. SO1 TaxID=1897061 RepID=UPI0010237B99|nr:fructose PTS transporter subunit IIA [Cryobacterium sp. SO1]RZI37265.1 PTS system fructose-specific EIIABC component [Cryobacterium sp. SO1]